MNFTLNTLSLLTGLLFSRPFLDAQDHSFYQTQNTMPMKQTNFSTSLLVEESPQKVFDAINNVKAWWSENIDGNTRHLQAEFFYNYKDVHACKIRIVEFVPARRIVWLVLENHFNFTKDQSEWKGNRLVFDITEENKKTKLNFTQEGLVPTYECYQVCSDAWTSYIQGSLKELITTGQGKPNTKENDLNKELIEKWGLPNK